MPRSLPIRANGRPIDHLSKSSINTYLMCPEKWRRRYVEGEREPAGVPLVLGKTVGAAIGAGLQHKISLGVDMALPDVLDLYSGEFDEMAETEEIKWDTNPGVVKDEGAGLVEVFQSRAAPHIDPVSVERRLEFRLGDADWTVQGYLDYEMRGGALADLKVKARKLSDADAAAQLDPLLYLAARRAEGSPAPDFQFHQLLRPNKTRPAEVLRTVVVKSDVQLDRFLWRVAKISQEIVWRAETGNWAGAPPGSWQCSARFCGFWDTCPMGGV